MDLLNIARMLNLIPEQHLGTENLHAKEQLEEDEQFCRDLEKAAHLYRLAESVAHKTQRTSPLDIVGRKRNMLLYHQFKQIWEYTCGEENQYLPIEDAVKALHLRSEDSLRRLLRSVRYTFSLDLGISVEAIRVLKMLQAEQSRKRDAERKRLRRASMRDGKGKLDASPLQEAKVAPDMAHTELLESLQTAFEQADVKVDASLFFEDFILDV